MAKAKKTKKEKVIEPIKLDSQLGETKLEQNKYEECEWCFQFDEDEPQIFAWTDSEMNSTEDPKIVFTITNGENSYINFQNGKSGKKFKLFARQLSDEGKSMRETQRESFKKLQNDSESKEA